MSLSELLAGLRRRWYAAVAGLLLTIGFCLAALSLVSAQYEANSTVLLTPPTTTVGAGGNPYLALGGLQGAADVVARAMSGAAVNDEVTPEGSSAAYTFEVDATSSAPMLVIQAKDSSAAGAIATLDKLLAKTPQVLSALQTQVGAPARSLITVGPITEDKIPSVNRKSQTRAVVLAGVVGLAILLFGTNLLDGYLVKRSTLPGQRAAFGAPAGGEGLVGHATTERRSVSFSDPVKEATTSRSRSLRLRPTEGGTGVESTGGR